MGCYCQNVKELINIHIHKRYDEFYNEWVWGIDEIYIMVSIVMMVGSHKR